MSSNIPPAAPETRQWVQRIMNTLLEHIRPNSYHLHGIKSSLLQVEHRRSPWQLKLFQPDFSRNPFAVGFVERFVW